MGEIYTFAFEQQDRQVRDEISINYLANFFREKIIWNIMKFSDRFSWPTKLTIFDLALEIKIFYYFKLLNS
jgi:hypothetical protein